MCDQGKYFHNVIEVIDRNGNSEYGGLGNGHKKTQKIYSYDEALVLAGRGPYTYGLVALLFTAFLGLALDLFGNSVILTGACDLNLTHNQKTMVLTIPFIGSVVMAWPWGYIADTQGRRKAMAYSLWGSFLLSTISAFSPNWIVYAVLKFGSCSLSSGTQSLGFTLLGESCSEKFKTPLLIGVTTSLISTPLVYMGTGYFVLNLDIGVDLGYIMFSNWRLLVVLFALPLGVAAAFLPFIYESPKFLINSGHEEKAIEILKKIVERNGGDATQYPVKEIALQETITLRQDHVPFWQSLRDQTLPLFKPPLVYRTMQLFHITATIYATNNGFFLWMPFVLDTFYSGYNVNGTAGEAGVCDMIVNSNNLNMDSTDTCVGTVKELVLWISVTQAAAFSVMNLGLSFLSRWKKASVIGLLLLSFTCGVLIPIVSERIASIVLMNMFLVNSLCMSVIFSYYVDLIPTSYRAMAGCLGIMVARSSSMVGSNLVGSYIDSHCTTSFYAWSGYILSGAVVCWFLP